MFREKSKRLQHPTAIHSVSHLEHQESVLKLELHCPKFNTDLRCSKWPTTVSSILGYNIVFLVFGANERSYLNACNLFYFFIFLFYIVLKCTSNWNRQYTVYASVYWLAPSTNIIWSTYFNLKFFLTPRPLKSV